jgi:hypothetical protein
LSTAIGLKQDETPFKHGWQNCNKNARDAFVSIEAGAPKSKRKRKKKTQRSTLIKGTHFFVFAAPGGLFLGLLVL